MSLATASVAAATALVFRWQGRAATYVKALLAALFLANWRSWPLVWHWKLFYDIPATRMYLYRRVEDPSFCVDPFKEVVIKARVSIDASDYNLHLSNSAYAKALDKARFVWLLEICGASLGSKERCWSPLGATFYHFFREIPLLKRYEIRVHTVSWDSKWIYYAARFVTHDKHGNEVLHAVALSKSTFKMRGSRLTIPPARVLSSAGCGTDRSNWTRTERLRAKDRSRDWLKYGALQRVEDTAGLAALKPEQGWEDDGLGAFEERRKDSYAYVDKFAESDSWKDM